MVQLDVSSLSPGESISQRDAFCTIVWVLLIGSVQDVTESYRVQSGNSNRESTGLYRVSDRLLPAQPGKESQDQHLPQICLQASRMFRVEISRGSASQRQNQCNHVSLGSGAFVFIGSLSRLEVRRYRPPPGRTPGRQVTSPPAHSRVFPDRKGSITTDLRERRRDVFRPRAAYLRVMRTPL